MIEMKIDVKKRGFLTWTKGKRNSAIMNALKFALRVAGSWWYAERLPRHFGPGAGNRYGYSARSQEYKDFKRLLKNSNLMPQRISPQRWNVVVGDFQGWNEDLRFTGALRDEVIGRVGRPRVVGRTVSSAVLRIPIPIPHPMWPKNIKELTKINRGEQKQMGVIARKAFRQRLEQIAG